MRLPRTHSSAFASSCLCNNDYAIYSALDDVQVRVDSHKFLYAAQSVCRTGTMADRHVATGW